MSGLWIRANTSRHRRPTHAISIRTTTRCVYISVLRHIHYLQFPSRTARAVLEMTLASRRTPETAYRRALLNGTLTGAGGRRRRSDREREKTKLRRSRVTLSGASLLHLGDVFARSAQKRDPFDSIFHSSNGQFSRRERELKARKGLSAVATLPVEFHLRSAIIFAAAPRERYV